MKTLVRQCLARPLWPYLFSVPFTKRVSAAGKPRQFKVLALLRESRSHYREPMIAKSGPFICAAQSQSKKYRTMSLSNALDSVGSITLAAMRL
jgi:hypothetical protein